MNAHVGETSVEHEISHGGFGFGTKNDPGEEVLNLADAHGLLVANTLFKKKPEHLITYKSGQHATQIDYWLCSTELRKTFKDCKVIPGEPLASQHRLLLLEMNIERKQKTKDSIKPVCKIKWQNLEKEKG